MSDEDEGLHSWGWTDLSAYSDGEPRVTSCQRDVMRRSLRLDEGLLDRSLPPCSSSFSLGAGGGSWRGSRNRRCHRLSSTSCSESLLQPPISHNPLLQESLQSDASLLSSLLDDSSIQESTLIDTFWGLDADAHHREDGALAEETSALIGLGGSCSKHPPHPVSHVYRGAAGTPEPSVYSRGRSCRSRTGRTGADAFRWVWRRWCHVTADVRLTGAPLRLVLVSLPLLLLLSLCWFGPDSISSLLPGLNVSAWRTAVSDVPGSSTTDILPPQNQSGESAVRAELRAELRPELGEEQPTEDGPPPAGPSAQGDPERLLRVEQSLALLWAEHKQGAELQLYNQLEPSGGLGAGLQQQLEQQLEQQLSELRGRLEEERQWREQMRWLDLLHQRRQTSRLDQLELQLTDLVARTQDLQRTPEASSPGTNAVSVGGDPPSHDALLSEVSRLEAAVGTVRRDVDGLARCWDGELSRIQQMISEQVSARVREEVQARVPGNQLLPGVSEADLQEALVSLELRLLQNLSLQRRGQDVGGDVGGAPSGTGAVTREDVQEMLSETLQRFSEDRTGLADYALESGGGSILSTRCSETYETKAALLSLLGVPLWYFSQSPRAVIQPDVQPGNCWAFRGSTGFLVIRLSSSVLPSAFTLEHLPRALAPSGTLRSAPRDFRVYGLQEENQDPGTLLGAFTYDQDGPALQTFPAAENRQPFQIIEVQVSSNWGHPDYTCMYRFRVHGRPAPPDRAGPGSWGGQ